MLRFPVLVVLSTHSGYFGVKLFTLGGSPNGGVPQVVLAGGTPSSQGNQLRSYKRVSTCVSTYQFYQRPSCEQDFLVLLLRPLVVVLESIFIIKYKSRRLRSLLF